MKLITVQARHYIVSTYVIQISENNIIKECISIR